MEWMDRLAAGFRLLWSPDPPACDESIEKSSPHRPAYRRRYDKRHDAFPWPPPPGSPALFVPGPARGVGLGAPGQTLAIWKAGEHPVDRDAAAPATRGPWSCGPRGGRSAAVLGVREALTLLNNLPWGRGNVFEVGPDARKGRPSWAALLSEGRLWEPGL